MKFLMYLTVITLAITVAVVSGRSASLPETAERKLSNSQSNAIILDVPVSSGDASKSKKSRVDGDRQLLKGKNFTNQKDTANDLEEDSVSGTTTEPYSLVIPVARNFSSLKELFEILREDDSRPRKRVGTPNQSYVRGTEARDSDYTVFFTS